MQDNSFYWDDNQNTFLNAALFGPNKEFNINEYDVAEIFYNDIFEDDPEYEKLHIWDNVEYKINKNGYRSQELKNKTDLLITGCSVTFGAGLNQEYTWPAQLYKELKLEYSNLALAGTGVISQIKEIFAYFKKFGHPKYIVALFPEFDRFYMPNNDVLMKVRSSMGDPKREEEFKKRTKSSKYFKNYLKTAHIRFDASPNYAKKPYLAEEVLPSDLSYFYSAQYILMLEQYCKLAGIKFVYGTWVQKQYDVLKKMNFKNPEYYNNIIDMKQYRWQWNAETKTDDFFDGAIKYGENCNIVRCHQDLKLISGEQFERGMDRQMGIDNAHWGAHRNKHFAEIIAQYMKKNWLND